MLTPELAGVTTLELAVSIPAKRPVHQLTFEVIQHGGTVLRLDTVRTGRAIIVRNEPWSRGEHNPFAAQQHTIAPVQVRDFTKC